jgi:hypothetical protein
MLKKITLLALVGMLFATPVMAASVSVSSHVINNGFGRVLVYADSCNAATLVTSPTIQLKNPAWTWWGYTGAVTPFVYLPITITPYSTTGSDTIHVGIETSEDNLTWYSFYNYALQVSVTAQGTPRIHYLLLPQRYMRVKLYAILTASYGEKVYINYPTK